LPRRWSGDGEEGFEKTERIPRIKYGKPRTTRTWIMDESSMVYQVSKTKEYGPEATECSDKVLQGNRHEEVPGSKVDQESERQEGDVDEP
jgi:hypothetical protein